MSSVAVSVVLLTAAMEASLQHDCDAVCVSYLPSDWARGMREI